MGSFDVSCSVSNLSITPGTKCLLLPLMRNGWHFPESESLGSMFIGDGPNASYFFSPLSCPIVGVYDDYGRIGNIQKNKTTEVLEKYFEISIDNFCRILTCGREKEDSFSEMYQIFHTDKNKGFRSIEMGGKYLLELGFTKIQAPARGGSSELKTSYRFKDHEVYVRIVNRVSEGKKYPFYKIYSKGKLRKKGRKHCSAKDFLLDYTELTGYLLGFPEKHHETIKKLEKLSAMFIHGEVYDLLSASEFGEWGKTSVWETNADVNEHTLTVLGFIKNRRDNNIDPRYNIVYKHPEVSSHIVGSDGTWCRIYDIVSKKQSEAGYHPDSFIKAWKEVTNHQLTIPFELKGSSTFVAKFDELQKSFVNVDSFSKTLNDVCGDLERAKDIRVFLIEKCNYFNFSRYAKYPIKFTDLYEKFIKDGSAKDEFVKFANFFVNINGMNKFLFPGPYAGQSGDNFGQAVLASKIVEIVKAEQEEYKEYEIAD